MPKGITHCGEMPPGEYLYLSLEFCSSSRSFFDCDLNILDNKVNMNGRPMATILPHLRRVAARRRSGLLLHQINRRRSPKHLSHRVPKQKAAESQVDGLLVERNGLFQLGNINVDENFHCYD